jgi:hypothetical protein
MGLKLLGNELKIEGMHRILKVYDKNIVDLVERVSMLRSSSIAP